MKGISNAVLAVIFIISLAAVAIGTWSITELAVTKVPTYVAPAIEFDGEFDDAFLPEKGWWPYHAIEQSDCNITSDVLGGSDHTSCIYDTIIRWAGGTAGINASTRVFSYVYDIDGPVEAIDFDIALQNTGTCQLRDDAIISDAKLYRYDDDIGKADYIVDLTSYIEDNVDLEAELTRPNDAAYFDGDGSPPK